jgi:hypothetical protein
MGIRSTTVELRSAAFSKPFTIFHCTTMVAMQELGMPGKPFRSKLEPFHEFISKERRKRATWKEIAEAIKKKGTSCTGQGVSDYFRRYRKLEWPAGLEPLPPEKENRLLNKIRGTAR